MKRSRKDSSPTKYWLDKWRAAEERLKAAKKELRHANTYLREFSETYEYPIAVRRRYRAILEIKKAKNAEAKFMRLFAECARERTYKGK